MRVKESVIRNVVTLVDGVEQNPDQLATMDFLEKYSDADRDEICMAVVMAVSRGWITSERSAENQQKFYIVSDAGKRVMRGW
jgi:hypothetical protein